MKKSYILKFNETMGDYVIVEQENADNSNNFVTEEKSKNKFFTLNFFKNFRKDKKEEQNDEKVSQKSFLTTLDDKLIKKEKEKKDLEEDLQALQKLMDVEIKAEDNSNSQNPAPSAPETNPTTPTTPTTPQVPERISPQEPTNQNPINNRTSVNEGIQLLTQNYNNFRVLNNIYQNMRDVSQETSQNFSDFIVTNRELQGGLLNIYFSVSGQSNPPRENIATSILPRDFQDIAQVAIDFLTKMREINLKLKKIFMVESFDRQFDLIENSLSLQNDFLSNLLVRNMTIKNKENI